MPSTADPGGDGLNQHLVGAVNDLPPDDTLLLVLPALRELYPMSTAALRQADNSRRRLREDYRGALIVGRDGVIQRIEHIEVLGPRGEGWFGRLLSSLTLDWHISVRLSGPLDLPLTDVKALIAQCLTNGEAFLDSFEPDILAEAFTRSVQSAVSVSAVVELFQLASPDDALDLL